MSMGIGSHHSTVMVDDERVEVMVIDYDTEGADEDEIIETHNGDEAYKYDGSVKTFAPEEVNKFFNL